LNFEARITLMTNEFEIVNFLLLHDFALRFIVAENLALKQVVLLRTFSCESRYTSQQSLSLDPRSFGDQEQTTKWRITRSTFMLC